MSETVPWTFQIVDVVFVLRASTYSLYFDVDIWIVWNDKIIYAVNLKIENSLDTSNKSTSQFPGCSHAINYNSL